MSSNTNRMMYLSLPTATNRIIADINLIKTKREKEKRINTYVFLSGKYIRKEKRYRIYIYIYKKKKIEFECYSKSNSSAKV